ncbi:hypothetical protein cypCar_00038831 [Cyprinus carpio]|nr:hypothetical protein cypCar_00038831 [Cyprinus carpio]
MESDIGNACMKLIYEDARVHGKYIYTADMYVVTTWKDSVDPLTYFPDDADMKDALVFPLWTKAASPEHYLLCVFPQQTNSIDCGVFMLMYALYTVLNTPFNFTSLDMPAIREWWCLRLTERFETEGSFPGLTHDLPQHVVAERNRMLSNQALVDFIVARGTENHIQSIINGQKKSKWLDTFSKCSIKEVPVPSFTDDQEQIDVIYTHLTSVLDSTHTHPQ